MRLIQSTEHLVIGGLAYKGFPILLWDTLDSCVEANSFFRSYLMRGAIGSRKSWKAISQSVYDFFGFLEAHDLAWDDVDRGEDKTLVAAYRDYCRSTANLAPATIRQRLVYVCEFYAFAKRENWISKLPFGYEVRHVSRAPGLLAHTDASGGKAVVRDVMPPLVTALPKFLTKDQVHTLLAMATNVHHRILVRLALGTGLRREELATFPLSYVFDPDLAGRRERNVKVRLEPHDGSGMKTKGSKPRDIYLPRGLMKDLHHYAKHYRGERTQGHARAALFLNQSGEPFADDGKGLERIVRSLGSQVGLKVWPHLLRHTYATHTLVALQRQGDRNRVEPLVFLQHQLGHFSIQTTMVYLHVVNDMADEAVLAYDDELDDWIASEPDAPRP
jgi:integrase/recombinase XerD